MSKSVVAASSPFQAYKGEVSMVLICSQEAAGEFKQLLETTDEGQVLKMDRLIKLPAFVEDGVASDHPRSRERWMSRLWNAHSPNARVTHLVESTIDGDERIKLEIRLELDIMVPKVRAIDEELNFALGFELARCFDDCQLLTAWKLTDENGDAIYGAGGSPALLQKQTERHEDMHMLFDTPKRLMSEVASA